MKQIRNGKDVRRLLLDPTSPNTFLLASRNAISRSTDGGITWTALPIISPDTVDILAFAINAKKSNEMYYGTATTFYRSIDGGQHWSTDKLPTRRFASAILIDQEKPEVVYLGVLQPAQ